MGLPVSPQGIVPSEMEAFLPHNPWEMARQLASEDQATGLTHGDFMPGNVLMTDSGATLLDFGNAGQDCLRSDVARYCLGLCLTRPITDVTLLCDAFLKGYAAVRPLGDVLARCLPRLVYLAGFRIALWRYSHMGTGLSWRDPLQVGAGWLSGEFQVREQRW